MNAKAATLGSSGLPTSPPEGLATRWVPDAVRPVTDREFRQFQGLILEEAGIFLSEAKKALLMGRLTRRLKELGLQSFGAYFERVAASEDERARMLDLITTNETEFFREPQHFEFLQSRVFPAWEAEVAANRRGRCFRVWSAGCSSGEEPYSIAMALLDRFPRTQGFTVDILATDLSNRILQRARDAVWPLERSRRIPQPLLKRFMLRGFGSQTGRMRAGPALREVVRFDRVNLNDQPLPVSGPFDLIFCRNVLIYFAPAERERVIHQLLERLSPEGHLFLGHAETLNAHGDRVRTVIPTVYQLLPASLRRDGAAQRTQR